MDDLLRHCMRELAFDGNLGCDVSRLHHFIEAFYNSQDSPGSQKVDDSFHAFVWSLLVQQPSVRIGLVPQGSAVEVYIAPQLSKKNKAVKFLKKNLVPETLSAPREIEDADIHDETTESSLECLQLIGDSSANSLNALIQKYGDGLRVAVDPETSFRALTGSHARPTKLSPMVYTALQLISRGREGGLSVVDLGKKTGYDQKTCFYLIKQLCELDLVVKLSKGGPGGGNFCIHKYFFTRSPFWEGIRREEAEGKEVGISEHQGQTGHENSAATQTVLQFDPIDSRHLSSVQLIKSRLLRLLKNSENGLHTYQNLLVALGFATPTKRDRRFFIVRIRELIKEGFIEKVVVPKLHGYSKTLCVRLVEHGRTHDVDGTIVQPVEVGDDEPEAILCEDKERDMPVVNLTIHRQILKLLDEAGRDGLTLNDISARLGNFDKRTVELLLSRLERTPPPAHLADLAACDVVEHHGRERRHRYYTLPGYLSFIQRENIDHAGRTAQHTSMDFSHRGEFFSLTENLFYKDQASRVAYEDGYRDIVDPRGVRARKTGRPRKDATTSKPSNISKGDAEITVRTPREKKKVAKVHLNIKTPDEPQGPAQKTSQRGTKRKRNILVEDGESDLRPPSKRKGIQGNAGGHAEVSEKMETVRAVDSAPVPTQMRGRKPKMVEPGPPKQTGRRTSSRKPSLGPMAAAPSSTNIPESTQPIGPNLDVIAASKNDKSATNIDTSVVSPAEPSVVFLDERVAMDNGSRDLHSVPGSAEFSRSPQSSDSPSVINPSAGLKRRHNLMKDDVAENEAPPSKRSKPSRSRPHALVNISQMRAENEFIRAVAACGGITSISSRDFLETHARIIATMSEAGEPTSMPAGTRPDRRTIRKIFERLEERGRLKTLTVTVAPRVGQPRPVKLAYEPEVSQKRLDQYLVTLREDAPMLTGPTHKKLEEPVNFTRSNHHRARDLLLTRRGVLEGGNEKENWRRHPDMSGMDDDAIRSSILSEIQTVAQLYGFLIGRAKRARELHLFTLAHLQGIEHSPYIVSQAERIVAFPYYYCDLPVSTYFAIISSTECNAELSALAQTSQGRQTLVKDLPLDTHDKLKIGRARARDKILGLLVILTSLKLVTPLQPCAGETPYLTCETNGDHPTCFDIASISDTRYNASSPSYWRFNTIAPIYPYSMTEYWPPPFYRDMFVRTADESISFWFELENACLNKDVMEPVTSMDSITGPCVCTLEVARGLRRSHSWISDYMLSSQQKQYLLRWTDPSTGYTPLSDADGGRDSLVHICSVISAPLDAVHKFFSSSQAMLMKQLERIHEREQKRQEGRVGRKAAEDRALLAKKAIETRRQLEADWDALVLRVHPTPAPYGSGIRLKQLRTQYLQSRASMNTQKWEATVLEAISGSGSGRRNPVLTNIAAMPHKMSRRVGISRLPPVATNRQKSVTELIDRQKERLAVFQALPQKKKSKGGISVDPNMGGDARIEGPRRQRFQWTPEYDELARDASAIIKSRCRTWHRMDWTALDQLFPFLPRNNVRQRIVMLRQEAGGDSYLRLLEDKWHELWVEHRGTEALPDENPTHPSEFDAIAHVEFLRKYIDKRSLRVGLPDADLQNAAGAILTETLTDFFSTWTVDEKPRPSNKMDVVWNATGDEHREKAFLGEAFSLTPPVFNVPAASHSVLNGVAESGLKMALATPEEDYDINNATTFLDSIGKDAIYQASEELLARGVVSESGRGHRKIPGRKLKISSLNEDALGGPFHSDFYAEACAIEYMFDETSDWREWSVIATDGEMAALIDLVSARKVDFQIDVSGPASQRQLLDWNSKKVDDDQITTTLAIQFQQSRWDDAVPVSNLPEIGNETRPGDFGPETLDQISLPMDVAGITSVEHGQNGGVPAPCRKTGQGIITCSACLDAEQYKFLENLDLDEAKPSLEIIERLGRAGWNGLSLESLQACNPESQGAHTTIDRMVSGSAPQCYWVGYASPLLVSRRHIREWTVPIPGASIPWHVFPRRWLNIKGKKMVDVWNAGLRAVVGVLVIRPGISQAELRQRLISVYDRQELNDLLQYLAEEGLIARKVSQDIPEFQLKNLRGMNVTEEQKTCWTLTWNAWYRVNMN